MCATIGVDGFINWIPIVGGLKRAPFCFYLRTVCDRIAQLYPDQQSWIVMDAASVYRGTPVDEVIREFPNIHVKYNTAWTPQLNPLDQAFSTWKHYIGEYLAKSPEGGRHAVHRAIRAAAQHITPDKCANWYRHLYELWPYFLEGCPDPEEAHRHGDRSATAAHQDHMHIVEQDEDLHEADYAAALNENYNRALRENDVPSEQEDDTDSDSSGHRGHGGETADRSLIGSDSDDMPDAAVAMLERTLTARLHTAPTPPKMRSNCCRRYRKQVATEPGEPLVDNDAETSLVDSTADSSPANADRSPHSAGSRTGAANEVSGTSRSLSQGHEAAFPPDMPEHPLHGRMIV